MTRGVERIILLKQLGNLVHRLLHPDTEKRMTVQEALDADFLQL